MNATDTYPTPTRRLADAFHTPIVYVIDGDPSARTELDCLIRSAGWQVRAAGSAEEFLARPRLMVPGCLLVEPYLPGLSGLELQRLILDRTELPVIFMSAYPICD